MAWGIIWFGCLSIVLMSTGLVRKGKKLSFQSILNLSVHCLCVQTRSKISTGRGKWLFEIIQEITRNAFIRLFIVQAGGNYFVFHQQTRVRANMMINSLLSVYFKKVSKTQIKLYNPKKHQLRWKMIKLVVSYFWHIMSYHLRIRRNALFS